MVPTLDLLAAAFPAGLGRGGGIKRQTLSTSDIGRELCTYPGTFSQERTC